MFEDIQPDDNDDTAEAARNTVEKRQREVQRDAELQRDARIIDLMKQCEVALTGNKRGEIKAVEDTDRRGRGGDEDEELWGARDPNELLISLGALLESHEDVQQAALSLDTPQRTAMLWRTIRDRRHRGEHVQDLVQELSVYADMAKHAGLIGDYTDRSKYAPVRLQALDIPGQRSNVEEGEQTPIARLRVGASEAVELDDRVVTLPTRDCRHILVVADPRQGKDSTICRIAGNLKEEHNYKWISIYDDGRNENRMIQIPSDDPGIQDSLDTFGQAPKGYPTDVFIPATDLPDELPDNHKPFSVSVDELTPDILARLAGIKPSEQTEQRISQALDDVQDGSGRVSDLIEKLRVYAEETNARITVEEPDPDPDSGEDGGEDMEYDEYEMSADNVLKDIVESLTIAAGQGIIRDRGASTNIDMQDVIADQERVAALNANHVDDSLKHLCVLIWLELIWKARGENPDLPRVALEAREIKNLAPSKLSDVKYTSIAQGLQQIFYLYSSQGSARRIMMLGSVQKIRDLYKSIRSNMDIMILLKLKSEKVNELQFGFSAEERSQIQGMQQGWGMIAGGGEQDDRPSKVYPINFCGARCGLGFGDVRWLTRYASAAGWRVADGSEELDEWIDGHGDTVSSDEETLEPGDWYLRTRDVSDYETLQDCLEDRMRDGMPETVMLHDPGEGVEEIDMELVQSVEDGDETIDMDVPPGLEPWMDHSEKVDRWVRVLRVIDEETVTSYGELADRAGTTTSTIGDDMDRPVGACIDKRDGEYVLTALGRTALDVDWTPLTRA